MILALESADGEVNRMNGWEADWSAGASEDWPRGFVQIDCRRVGDRYAAVSIVLEREEFEELFGVIGMLMPSPRCQESTDLVGAR